MPYQCVCRECHRIFYADDLGEYVYKRGAKYFCSWKCLRRYDKKREAIDKELQINGQKKPLHK